MQPDLCSRGKKMLYNVRPSNPLPTPQSWQNLAGVKRMLGWCRAENADPITYEEYGVGGTGQTMYICSPAALV